MTHGAVDAAAVCRRLNAALDIMTVKGVKALPWAPSGRAAKHLAESTGLEARTAVFRQAASSRFVRSAHQINRGVFPSLPAKGEDSDFHLVAGEEPEFKRNLIQTGITRGKKLVVLVGQERGLAMAVKGQQTERRWSRLKERRLRTSPFGLG
jgi:ATP-dependent exoDNAse (exonuclease V) alpha subunit